MTTARSLPVLALAALGLTAWGLSPSQAHAGASPGQTQAQEGPTASLQLPSLALDPELVDEATRQQLEGVSRTYTYRRTYGRRYYRSRYYYPRYYHSSVVVVDPTPPPPAQVVVTDPPIVKQRRGYTPRTSLSLRTVTLNYGDTTLDSGSIDGAEASGLGVGLRVPLDRHWGLEFALDLAQGSQGDADLAVMPITASLMARLFPASRLDVYGLAGAGIYQTAVRYRDRPDESFMQLGAHAGGGVELKFGHLLLTADVRFLFLEARPDPLRSSSRTTSQGLLAEDSSPAPTTATVEDDFQNAVQGMLGVGYRW